MTLLFSVFEQGMIYAIMALQHLYYLQNIDFRSDCRQQLPMELPLRRFLSAKI